MPTHQVNTLSDEVRSWVPDRFLTDLELAEYLGISRGMVHKLKAQGMPFHKFGRSCRYLAPEVVAWADGRQEAA